MNTDITEKPKDDSAEHKLGRKEVIHLGFQSKTRGEAAFNLISYAGFGYFVVTATSVFMTWLLNDKVPAAGKAIGAFTKRWGASETFGNIATLFMGGTLASVLPVKWLEDRKSKAVKKLDYLLYDENQFYNDPKIQAVHKELDEVPKQTWLSVAGSRVVAFAATLGVFALMGGNKSPIAKLTGRSLDDVSTKAGRWIDRAINKGNPTALAVIDNAEARNLALPREAGLPFHKVLRDEIGANGEVIAKGDRIPSRIYSYLSLDMIYTVITSASLWVSTRIFGAVVGKPATLQVSSALTQAAEKKEAERAPYIAKSEVSEPTLANSATPPTKITAPTHLDRISQPSQQAELTA